MKKKVSATEDEGKEIWNKKFKEEIVCMVLRHFFIYFAWT